MLHGSLEMPKDIAVLGGDPAGNYFSPIVLEDIPRDSIAYREEFFGPVFSLFAGTTRISGDPSAGNAPRCG